LLIFSFIIITLIFFHKLKYFTLNDEILYIRFYFTVYYIITKLKFNNFKKYVDFHFKALYYDFRHRCTYIKKEEKIVNIEIENVPNYRIAYIRNIGPYGEENVQAMEKLKEWAKSNKLFNDKSIILGIALDNPEIAKPESCRYDTCLVISNDYIISEDYINDRCIVGGKYAVFKIKHTAEEVQRAWCEIFPNLLTEGYQFDDSRPILERYKVQMVNEHYCEICVPIH